MNTGGEHTYQFMGFESAQKLGYTIEGKDYKMVYAAPWTPTITLEDIFERFNINRPNNFHGHSSILQRNGSVLYPAQTNGLTNAHCNTFPHK